MKLRFCDNLGDFIYLVSFTCLKISFVHYTNPKKGQNHSTVTARGRFSRVSDKNANLGTFAPVSPDVSYFFGFFTQKPFRNR